MFVGNVNFGIRRIRLNARFKSNEAAVRYCVESRAYPLRRGLARPALVIEFGGVELEGPGQAIVRRLFLKIPSGDQVIDAIGNELERDKELRRGDLVRWGFVEHRDGFPFGLIDAVLAARLRWGRWVVVRSL